MLNNLIFQIQIIIYVKPLQLVIQINTILTA